MIKLMNTTVGDFFLLNNSVGYISEQDYENAKFIINAAKAFSRSTYQGVYIIDYFKKGFVYVSDNISKLCGQPAEKIKDFGYELYIKHVPSKEQEMLKEINKKGFDLFETIPVGERNEYTMQYDFHITNERKFHMVHHTLTPLTLAKDGKIWLALCTISMSSRSSYGHIVMKRENSKTYFEYDLERHRWAERTAITLSEMERNILWLSTQGFTMTEIADKLFKSIDTIKSCKRNLFARLGTKNIAEALYYVVNYRLI